jgi:hypothetical protein
MAQKADRRRRTLIGQIGQTNQSMALLQIKLFGNRHHTW